MKLRLNNPEERNQDLSTGESISDWELLKRMAYDRVMRKRHEQKTKQGETKTEEK